MRFPTSSDLPRRTEPLHLALTVSVPRAISGQTKRLRQKVAAHLDAWEPNEYEHAVSFDSPLLRSSPGGGFTDLVIDTIFGADLRLVGALNAQSKLEGFDANARLVNLRHQGKKYMISRNGAAVIR